MSRLIRILVTRAGVLAAARPLDLRGQREGVAQDGAQAAAGARGHP